MARFLALEQPLGVPRQFEDLYPLVHVGLLSGLMPLDLAQATVLLLAPLGRHLVEERAVHPTVELVEIHGVDAVAEALVLGVEPPDRRLVFAPFIGMARVQSLTHPGQHLVVELEPTEQRGELLLYHLLADIAAAAGGRVTLALIGVAGAVIVDVALLLDLPDDRAAAFGTGKQPRKGEVVRHAAMSFGETAVENTLHPFPQLERDQRLVPALELFAVPLEPAGIQSVT